MMLLCSNVYSGLLNTIVEKFTTTKNSDTPYPVIFINVVNT